VLLWLLMDNLCVGGLVVGAEEAVFLRWLLMDNLCLGGLVAGEERHFGLWLGLVVIGWYVVVGVSGGGLGLVDRLICRYDFLGSGEKATLRVQTSDYFYLTEKHLLLVKPLTLHAKLGFMRAHRGITQVTSEGGVGRTLDINQQSNRRAA
jgi:hypothetical protein